MLAEERGGVLAELLVEEKTRCLSLEPRAAAGARGGTDGSCVVGPLASWLAVSATWPPTDAETARADEHGRLARRCRAISRRPTLLVVPTCAAPLQYISILEADFPPAVRTQ